jgi:hypothetical protein
VVGSRDEVFRLFRCCWRKDVRVRSLVGMFTWPWSVVERRRSSCVRVRGVWRCMWVVPKVPIMVV